MSFRTKTLPSYQDLWRDDMRGGVAWGVFGDDDQLGTLNFLDEECVRSAASCVKSGQRFALSLGPNFFEPPLSLTRGNARQELFVGEISLDDKFDNFYPQASSQWDALKHYGHPKYGFYNGKSRQEIVDNPDLLSITNIARTGIVGRAVLLDLARYRAAQGRPIRGDVDDVFTMEDIEGCLAAQGSTLEPGDIVLVRTGWLQYWNETGKSLPRGDEPPRCPGLVNDSSIAEFLWNQRVSAIAGDNRALEASPGPGGRTLHIYLMTFLGMTIGELWDFEALAAACAEDGRYESMLAAAPIDFPGGCGSTANAVAIR